MELADDDTVILVCSDHGGTPNQFQAVDIAKVLEETGFIGYKGGTQEIDWSKTRAVNVGLVHIFINLKGVNRMESLIQRLRINATRNY